MIFLFKNDISNEKRNVFNNVLSNIWRIKCVKLNVLLLERGYVSVNQIDAIRRTGFIEISGVADINYDLARQKADNYFIPKCYITVD